MRSSDRIHELTAEARYHRERLQLYRARFHGPRPATLIRLLELQRLSEHAERRLRHAEQDVVKRGEMNMDAFPDGYPGQ
jgi:hypothetical protein